MQPFTVAGSSYMHVGPAKKILQVARGQIYDCVYMCIHWSRPTRPQTIPSHALRLCRLPVSLSMSRCLDISCLCSVLVFGLSIPHALGIVPPPVCSGEYIYTQYILIVLVYLYFKATLCVLENMFAKGERVLGNDRYAAVFTVTF